MATTTTATTWPPPVDADTTWRKRWLGRSTRGRWVQLRTVTIGRAEVDIDDQGDVLCLGCGDLLPVTAFLEPHNGHLPGSIGGGPR